MTVIAAWQLPGGDGDAVILPAGIPPIRTGGDPHTIIVIRKLDTLDPAQRGCIWCARRTANNNPNHSQCFEPGNNNIEYQYGTNTVFEFPGNPVPASSSESAAGVWVGDCWIDPGGASNLILRRILFSTGLQTHTVTGASGGSLFDDGQPQTYTLGAIYNGSSWVQEMDGQIAIFLLVPVALSQAQCEAVVADPLNEGDTLAETYGSAAVFFDDTGSDRNLGSPTFNGAASRVAGIGPNVPDRDVPDPGTVPTILSVGSFNVVYDGEERVQCLVSNLGTSTPLVQLTNDSNGVLNLVTQTVFSYNSGTGQLVIHISLGALAAGAVSMFVTNQTPGVDFGQRDSQVIDVRANPGVSQIALRTTVPSQVVASGAAYSFAAAPYVYHSGSQEQGVYSVTGAPPGITINSSTGLLSGTLTAGAETSSPYLVKPRLTDANAAFAEQTFSHAVNAEVIPPPEPGEPTVRGPGSWGLRGRQST